MYQEDQREQALDLHQHLQRAYLALAEALRPPVTFESEPGVNLFWSRYGVPLGNGVLRTETSEERSAPLIERVQTRAAARGHPLLWLVGPASRPQNLAEDLRSAGMQPEETVVGMLLEGDLPPDPGRPPDLSITTVSTEHELRLWMATFLAGFELSEPASELFWDLVKRHRIVPSGRRQFLLGTRGGQPVATALLWADGELAGIYGVATLPTVRRQGSGMAITRAAVEAARRAGYERVTLYATAMGEPLSRRVGFVPVCSFQTFVWSPGANAPREEGIS